MVADDIPYRCRILYNGAKLTAGDRDKEYGEPVKNMQDIGKLWTAYIQAQYTGTGWAMTLTGEDVAHMMTLMKIARTFAPAAKFDTYVDSATYQGIAGECASMERPDDSE